MLATPIFSVFRKRVGWLLLLFLTESLIGTGGNDGAQTTSTIIRALAPGEIDLCDALRSLWHELQVGL